MTKEMTKGFAPPKPQVNEQYQCYTAELKKRFLTDDSELLLGTALVKVPKRLSDPTAQAYKRQVWDAFAKAVAYHMMFLEESQQRGVNQIFTFTNKGWLLDRVELNPWAETNSESGEVEEMADSDFNLIQMAVSHCQFSIEWLELPKA